MRKKVSKKKAAPKKAARPNGSKFCGVQKNMPRGTWKTTHVCRGCGAEVVEYGAAYSRRYCAGCNIEMRPDRQKIEE